MPESQVRLRKAWIVIGALALVLAAVATLGILLLLENIAQRQQEARQHVFRVVEVDENTIDPEIWGKNYPRQYDGYRRTVDTVRTQHGGSEAFQHLDRDPRWREIFKGYAFSVDYREDRGHAYMLKDQDETERQAYAKQPGACINCHASVLPAFRRAAAASGMDTSRKGPLEEEAVLRKGFDILNAKPYPETRKEVSHPVSCIDCHDANTMGLKVSRPAFLAGIRALAASDAPVPHLPSIERWRKEGRQGQYMPNEMASRQEMRSFVCGQCHVEYHFRGEGKTLTFPWSKGLKVEDAERHYDEDKVKDWVHAISGAQVLKAQHPEFEMWSQGIHARSGVACADCHMPYKREGAIKISDHHVRSPLLNVANACQTCHNVPETELTARALIIQDRNRALMDRAEDAVLALIHALEAATKNGAPAAKLDSARALQRKAQWRLDYVSAENSMGFHASQEAARILGEAIDYGRLGQLSLSK
ncbi:MAG TPA: ammonia-forming cytochrome c nitrite reductase subunit c552 [Fibrobacteria bacterium]|nr:ammonia-forming cytochrome c nitrite reductase subunit c552 [Fibrobacteria bacterium]